MTHDSAANLPPIWQPKPTVIVERVADVPGGRQLAALGRALLDSEAASLFPHDHYLQTAHVLGYDPLDAGSVWNAPA